jgi:ubiquitin-activating enzyme E1
MQDADTAKHSRVIYALGLEAFTLLKPFKVGVVGLTPTGTEIVKLLALTGVGYIDVFDGETVTPFDLGSNFLIEPSHVGRPRLSALLPILRSLNGRTTVTAVESVTDDWITSLHSLIVAELRPLSDLLRLSALCHVSGIQFVFAATVGPVSVLFEDFGVDFECRNVNGTAPKMFHISNVTNANPAFVTFAPCDVGGAIRVNERYEFSDVLGLPQLNGLQGVVKEVFRERKTDRTSAITNFRMDIDTSRMPKYDWTRGDGKITEVKSITKFNHAALAETLCGATANTGLGAAELPAVRDLVVQIAKFADERGRFPGLLSEDDADAVVAGVSGLDRSVGKKVVMCTGVEYAPNVGLIGGAAVQEAIKFRTHTFHPAAAQWFVVDNKRVITWERTPVLEGDRYDPLVVVVGNDVVVKVREASALIVGVGAVGCEYARYAALFGFRRTVLIDNDTVEPSNLTRQALFRDEHRGQAKADVGRDALLKQNPDLNVLSLVDLFDWRSVSKIPKGVDLFFSAVDSVPGRRLIAACAAARSRPMINAGLLKTDSDWTYAIPNITAAFSMRDEQRPDVASCTLKNEPTKPIHLIQRAHDEFIRLFMTYPQNALAVVDGDLATINQDTKVTGIHLLTHFPKTFADCVQWAFSKFTRVMEYLPTALLTVHPPDAIDSENGQPYWNGRVIPKVVPFNIDDPSHRQFVTTAALLKASVHSIQVPEYVMGEQIANCKKPRYRLERLSSDKDFGVVDTVGLTREFVARRAELGALAHLLRPLTFDKDDPQHLDFIEGYVVSRGNQTGIPIKSYSRMDYMRLVGSIQPTLGTTTSMVGGGTFALLPLLLADPLKPQPYSGMTTLNGLDYNTKFPAQGRKRFKLGLTNDKFSDWDFIEVEGKALVDDVLERIRSQYRVEVGGLTLGHLYLPAADGQGKAIVELIREKLHVVDDVYLLQLAAYDPATDDDVLLPPLRVWAVPRSEV